jgi:diaminopimelate epimerase
MQFWKAHAYGNDFLYARLADVTADDPVVLAQRMCARHTGVGADGLILFDDTQTPTTMRLINADGSDAEVSGNGVRALAALLSRLHGHTAAGSVFDVATAAGLKTLTLVGHDEEQRPVFRAAMGQPERIQRVEVDVRGETVPLVTLWMGNPQAVWLVDALDHEAMMRVGAALQRHPAFPQAINVELAKVASPDRVEILIYERGVGPTLSSGTGSCAAAVAAASFGGARRDVEVVSPGGSQRVEWTDEGVFLTGWADLVLEGHWIA